MHTCHQGSAILGEDISWHDDEGELLPGDVVRGKGQDGFQAFPNNTS